MSEEGLSASRIRKTVVVLKMLMDAAARDGMVRANPVVGVKQPRIERREAAYFAPEVVDQIAAAMPRAEYRLLVRVLGIGGLRFGEAAALDRESVDLLRRRLAVRASRSEVGGRLVRSPTKTYAVRQVPIPAGLAEELGNHLEAIGPGAPVFRGPHLGALRYGAFYGRVWKPTRKRLACPRRGSMSCGFQQPRGSSRRVRLQRRSKRSSGIVRRPSRSRCTSTCSTAIWTIS